MNGVPNPAVSYSSRSSTGTRLQYPIPLEVALALVCNRLQSAPFLPQEPP